MAKIVPTWLARHAAGLHRRLWWPRAVTLGVRIVVLDHGAVFLVRHTYLPGWYLPGGGVDRGESALAAAIRELREEGGIVCAEPPRLHGIFRNGRRDHVICYVTRVFTITPKASDAEIAETGFFALDALPEGTTRATRARLDEVMSGVLSVDW